MMIKYKTILITDGSATASERLNKLMDKLYDKHPGIAINMKYEKSEAGFITWFMEEKYAAYFDEILSNEHRNKD